MKECNGQGHHQVIGFIGDQCPLCKALLENYHLRGMLEVANDDLVKRNNDYDVVVKGAEEKIKELKAEIARLKLFVNQPA